MNNASTLIEAPDHVFIKKCSRQFLLFLLLSLVYLIRGRVTTWKEVCNLKKQYVSSGNSTRLLKIHIYCVFL